MGLGTWLLTGEWEKRSADVSPSPEPLTSLLPPSRDAAPSGVTVGDALTLGNVYRAVQIISNSAVQLSLDVYRNDELIPSPLFVRSPDVNDTFEGFLEMTVVSLATSGNAYWRIKRNDRNEVTNLEVLNPLVVSPVTNAFGRITAYSYTTEKPIPAEQVQHLKLLRTPGSSVGLGPIQAAQTELRGAIDVRNYAGQWFRDSGVPSGVLKTDAPISEIDAGDIRTQWNSVPAGQVRVLSDGLDYVSLFLNPADAQWIENRRFSKGEVATLFGIPPSLMNAASEGSSMTYTNVAQAWTEFTRFTLSGYLREIEVAFSTLLPRGTKARFNLEGLLRPDTKTRYEMHSLALNAGWMTPNDVRRVEGLEPITGGDELLKPPSASSPTSEEANNA